LTSYDISIILAAMSVKCYLSTDILTKWRCLC